MKHQRQASTPWHAWFQACSGHVEAVVVGSAIVRQIERDAAGLEALMRNLTRPLAMRDAAIN